MKRNLIKSAAALCATAFSITLQPARAATLGVGDPAPKLQVSKWVQGEPVKEPEFFSALMRIWLGRSPADAMLKDALLGKSGAERAPNEG